MEQETGCTAKVNAMEQFVCATGPNTLTQLSAFCQKKIDALFQIKT